MKIFKLLATAMWAACCLTLGSCSDDVANPSTPDEESNIVAKLTRGEESRTFVLEEVTLLHNDIYTNHEWVEINLKEILGYRPSLPYTIHITDGQTWSEYDMYDIINPNPLVMSWVAYRKVTGFNKKLFIVANIQYDEQDKKLSINDKYCTVEEETNDFVTLSYESNYWHGKDSNGNCETGIQREILKYSANALSMDDKENIMYFNSERELNECLLNMIRAEFGNEFNLNDYLKPYIELDEPMVNLDEIEKELLS